MLPPEPVNTARYEIPNACNDCHNDRDAVWAVSKVEEWYPRRDRKQQRIATAFTLAQARHPDAAEALIRIASDTNENPLIRAGAIGYLGVNPKGVSVEAVLGFTTENDPLIRLEATRALFGLAAVTGVDLPLSLLEDRYRAIRIQGAVAMLGLAFSDRPLPVDEANSSDSLELEADRVDVQVRLGNLDLFMGDLDAAAESYQAARRIDPGNLDALIGIGMAELGRGNRGLAIQYIRQALELSGGAPEYRNLLKLLENQP